MPGVWVVGGFSGHGMPFGMRMGQLVAHAVIDGKAPTELRPFRLDRATLILRERCTYKRSNTVSFCVHVNEGVLLFEREKSGNARESLPGCSAAFIPAHECGSLSLCCGNLSSLNCVLDFSDMSNYY